MFPPRRILILEHYDWQHTKEEVKAMWDFSRLESLSLHFVDIYNVLKTLTMSKLQLLKTLAIKKCLFLVDDDGDKFHGLITDLIVALPNLEEFLLHDSWVNSINIPVFFGYHSKITRLELLDTRDGEQMTADDSAHLVRACPDLRSLKTNLDPERHDVQRFLKTVAEFLKMNSMWLEVYKRQPTPLSASEEMDVDLTDEDDDQAPNTPPDPDYDAARSIIRKLSIEKVGVPFEKLIIVVRNISPLAGRAPISETSAMRMFSSRGTGYEVEEVWTVSYP
ncbi:hypothetical protein IFR05_006574 [Cadophora sp. M221]|nr:hypothetical protein IFR05_006574 [Cadophora sp. M221]